MTDTKHTHTKIRLAYQDKLDEREAWHKIVVKILSWRDGLLEGGSIKPSDKITVNEWTIYSQGIVRINVVHGKDKALKKLEETRKIISQHQGFEHN